MFDSELATCECRQQINLDLGEEMGVFSLEPIMRLLFNNNNDISGRYSGCLITLATESNRLATLHALIDVNLKHLLLGNDFLRIACLATVLHVDNLTNTRTFVARLLHLLDHRTHLTQGDAHTTTIASMACSYGTILATLAIALGADNVSCERKFRDLALVQIFERDGDTVNEILGLPWSLRPTSSAEESTSTKELAE